MSARLISTAALLALVSGSAQAQTIRQVTAPAGAILLTGWDAFNGGGAVGSAASAAGASGFISTPSGTTAIAPPAGATTLWFQGASADGSVLAGTLNTGFAVRYTAGGGVQSIGGLPTHNRSAAYRVSADGSTIVGESSLTTTANTQTAFRWTSAGMTSLGRLAGANNSSAWAVSADGSVVVGDSGGRAFRWTAADGIQPLTAAGQTLSNARAVSADGSTVWGLTSTNRPYRWTASGTTLMPASIGTPQVLDVSDDGSTAVGSANLGSSVVAVAWFGGEVYNLNIWLPTQGVDLQGWTLGLAIGVSSDGQTIAATGQRAGTSGVIVINLNRPLPMLIPAPGAATLLAGAGLLAARRRR